MVSDTGEGNVKYGITGRGKSYKIWSFLALIFFLLFLIASILFLRYYNRGNFLADQLTIAQSDIKEAAEQRKEAIIQGKISEQQQQIAEQQMIMTEQQRQFAVEQQNIAQSERKEAINQRTLAEEAKTEALSAKDEAESQRKEAVLQQQIANEQRLLAEKSEKNALRLRLLAIAHSLAIQSYSMQGTVEGDLPALLAYESYFLNKENGGSFTDPDIFRALSAAAYDGFTLRSHQDEVRDVTMNWQGNLLASCGMDGTVNLWNLDDENPEPEKLITIDETNPGFRCICFSKDGKHLFAGDIAGNVLMWDISLKNPEPKLLKGDPAIINDILYNPKEEKLITCNSDGKLRIWDMEFHPPTWMEIRDPQNTAISALCFNPEGKILLWTNFLGNIYMLNTENITSKPTLIISEGIKVNTMSIDPEGEILATGNKDGMIRLWDFNEPGIPKSELIGHLSGVNELAFFPSGNALASCSYDGTIRIWNTEFPEEHSIIIEDHDSWLYSVVVTSDGEKIISAGADGTIRVRTIMPELLARRICQSVSRNLTEEEWVRYIGPDIEYRETCSQ